MLRAALFCFLLVPCIVFGQAGTPEEVFVTSVTARGSSAEIILNDQLKIKGIKVQQNASGKTSLVFPRYTAKSGKVYRQVSVISDSLLARITSCVSNGRPEPKTADLQWEITAVKKMRKVSALKAFATVRFNRAVEVEAKIFQGSRGAPWIAWPEEKNPADGNWEKLVLFRREYKKQLDEALMERYKALKESGDFE